MAFQPNWGEMPGGRRGNLDSRNEAAYISGSLLKIHFYFQDSSCPNRQHVKVYTLQLRLAPL